MLADLFADGSAELRLDDTHSERALLSVDGNLRIDETEIDPGQLAVLTTGAEARVSGAGRALLIGGEPVGARSIWWNFVHSDPARIEDAKERWRNQSFPQVPDDHDPWVPLPS